MFLFRAVWVSPSFLVRFRVHVPFPRLTIHHGLNGAFRLAMQGEACRVTVSGSHTLKVGQALQKAGCYFLNYPVWLNTRLQSLSITEPLQHVITVMWRLCNSCWWFTADHLIFRALFINKLCSIYLVFYGIYESKVQSAPKIIHSSNSSSLCMIG